MKRRRSWRRIGLTVIIALSMAAAVGWYFLDDLAAATGHLHARWDLAQGQKTLKLSTEFGIGVSDATAAQLRQFEIDLQWHYPAFAPGELSYLYSYTTTVQAALAREHGYDVLTKIDEDYWDEHYRTLSEKPCPPPLDTTREEVSPDC